MAKSKTAKKSAPARRRVKCYRITMSVEVDADQFEDADAVEDAIREAVSGDSDNASAIFDTFDIETEVDGGHEARERVRVGRA